MNIELLLPFIQELDQLKLITRQTLTHNGKRKENSAEHSWHLALSVLIFSPLGPKNLNTAKAIQMALIHDIVEIDAGDTIIYSEQTQKKEKELIAIDRLSKLLPKKVGINIKELWLEFENSSSIEAKFVSALDRFLPIYSNYLNKGYSWKEHGISKSKVYEKNKAPIESGFAPLWEIAEKLIQESFKENEYIV